MPSARCWIDLAQFRFTSEQQAMVAANPAGDRATLKADLFIPLGMALITLLLLLYFMGIGGYRALKVEEQR